MPKATCSLPCKIWKWSTSGKYGWVNRSDAELLGLPISGYVHRAVWAKHNGSIPPGMVIMHECDTPLCYEPSHLRVGTRAENNADRAAKGRNGKTWIKKSGVE